MGIIKNICKVSVNITVILELILLIGYSTAESGGYSLLIQSIYFANCFGFRQLCKFVY